MSQGPLHSPPSTRPEQSFPLFLMSFPSRGISSVNWMILDNSQCPHVEMGPWFPSHRVFWGPNGIVLGGLWPQCMSSPRSSSWRSVSLPGQSCGHSSTTALSLSIQFSAKGGRGFIQNSSSIFMERWGDMINKKIKAHVQCLQGLPGGASGKEFVCQCRRHKRCGFNPWVGKIPWRRRWQPTLALLPGESHGQKSLAGHSPRVTKRHDRGNLARTHSQGCTSVRLQLTAQNQSAVPKDIFINYDAYVKPCIWKTFSQTWHLKGNSKCVYHILTTLQITSFFSGLSWSFYLYPMNITL